MNLYKKAITIAIVEDDESVLDATSIILENQGWNVLAYPTGELFLKNIQEHDPNFLILDAHLPGVSGDQVVSLMSTHVNKNNMHIIVLTAHPGSPTINALKQQGINDVLLKPVTEEELVDSIKKYL